MGYATSIPFLMRKRKVTPQEAKIIIDNMISTGLIGQDLSKEENQSIILRFTVERKYGRYLFYPKCENAKLIINGLLFQKSATKNQIQKMIDAGWKIDYSYRDPLNQ